MAVEVINVREVSLFGNRYPVLDGVRPYLANQIVPAITIGDGDPTREENVSKWFFQTSKGGHGRYYFRPGSGANSDQFWDSDVRTDMSEITLAPLAEQIFDFGGSTNVAATCEYSGYQYAFCGTQIRRWTGGAVEFYCTDHSAWETGTPDGVSHHAKALSSDAVSVGFFAGKMVVLCGTNVMNWDGTTWTNVVQPGHYGCFFGAKFYVISATSRVLYSTTDLAAFTNLVTVDDGTPTGLCVYEDGEGLPALAISTNRGPLIYNPTTGVVSPLHVRFSDAHADNGKGIGVWNGDLVFGKGGSVRTFTASQRENQQAVIGPNKDDGLVSTRLGRVVATETSLENMLLIAIDAGTANSAYSSVMAWRDNSWHTVVKANAANKSIKCLSYSTFSTIPRLHYGEGTAWWAIPWYDITANPRQAPSMPYKASGTYITYWMGSPEFRSMAIDIRMLCRGLTATETVHLYAAFDHDETTYTDLGTVPNNGATILTFSNGGRPFRTIRIKMVLARGATTTTTPIVTSACLRWTPLPRPIWGFGFEVDASRPYGAMTPADMEANLILAASTAIGTYSHQDDDDHSVRIRDLRSLGATGGDPRSHWTVDVIELTPANESLGGFNWDGEYPWDGTAAWG